MGLTIAWSILLCMNHHTQSWQSEHHIETSAAPEVVWDILKDVAGWKQWNAGIEEVELHGPFVSGSEFTMKPPGQDAFRSRLLDVQENEGFVDETRVGDLVVTVSHRIRELRPGRVRVTYAMTAQGDAASEIGAEIASDFPQVLGALRKLAEARLEKQGTTTGETARETVRETAQRLWDSWTKMWNEDPRIAESIVADRFFLHLTKRPGMDPASVHDGPSVCAWVTAFRKTREHLVFTTGCGPFVDERERTVAGPWIADRTINGVVEHVCGIDILRFREGRITEYWTLSKDVDDVEQWNEDRSTPR